MPNRTTPAITTHYRADRGHYCVHVYFPQAKRRIKRCLYITEDDLQQNPHALDDALEHFCIAVTDAPEGWVSGAVLMPQGEDPALSAFDGSESMRGLIEMLASSGARTSGLASTWLDTEPGDHTAFIYAFPPDANDPAAEAMTSTQRVTITEDMETLELRLRQ